MKHMNLIHQQVLAGHYKPAVVVAMESHGTIAMEGLGDKIKEGWEAFKKRVSPTDHEAIVSKLLYLPKLRAALVDAKSRVSQATGDVISSKLTQKITKDLPVSASNADQLIREVSTYRKRIESLMNKAMSAKSPEAVAKARQELAMEFSKKGNVSDGITFTKPQVLKLMDEAILFVDSTEKLGKVYVADYESGRKEGNKAAMESFKSMIAMESLDEVLSVAMESVILGVATLIGALIVRLIAIICILAIWLSISTGNIHGAIGGAVVGIPLLYISRRMIESSVDQMMSD